MANNCGNKEIKRKNYFDSFVLLPKTLCTILRNIDLVVR